MSTTTRRRDLKSGDILKVLHYIDEEHSFKRAYGNYGVSKRILSRILNARTSLVKFDSAGSTIGVLLPLKRLVPDVEFTVPEFVVFVRHKVLCHA